MRTPVAPPPEIALPPLSDATAQRCALLTERVTEIAELARKIRVTLAAAPPRRRAETEILRAYVVNTWEGELCALDLPTILKEPAQGVANNCRRATS